MAPRRPVRGGFVSLLLPTLILMCAGATPPARAAAPDGNVEWAGVCHLPWLDRRPLCPVGGESFVVRFQSWRDDLTSARAEVTTGGNTSWAPATRVGTRGPYDIWEAALPATASGTLSYALELTDGGDADWYGPAGMSDGPPAAGFELDFTTLAHAPVGATPVTGGGAVFRVWAPTRSTAHVRGEFNGWGLGNPLAKVGEHFIGHVTAPVAGRAQYKYFFNSSVWNTDPRGRSLEPGSNYNAHVENPLGYVWTSGDFETPALEDMVIYQLHVGTFAGRNDPVPGAPFPAHYLDVAARASHLAELGVNAVMLNPITEFPTDESVGYNPVTQWAPEWRYGTPDQLKAMVDTLHARGIAVLLDVVWNHFSFTDNYLWNYDGSQQWFDTPAVDTPWGSQADFDRGPVRDYFAHSAHHWLEEYRLDGFRMDATEYMKNTVQGAAGWTLMGRLNDELDNRWSDKPTIAEQLPDDASITRPTSLGGAGFDAQYYDAFVDNLRQEIFDAAFGDPEMWRIQAIVQGGGAWLSGRSVVNYVELHDEAWPESGGQRLAKSLDTTAPHDDVWAQGRTKLAHGLVLLAPGVPAFLMGAEWLEDTDFGSGYANRIDWAKKTTYAPYFEYFKKVIGLRRAWPAFRASSPVQVFHVNEGGNVLAFRRTDPAGNPFVVIANFSNTDYASYRLGAPRAGAWTELVNSQSVAYGGNGLDNPGALATEAVAADGFAQSLVLTIPRMGLLALGPADVVDVASGPGAAAHERGVRFVRVAPVPARGGTSFELEVTEAGRVRLELFDARGRRAATVLDAELAPGRHSVRWEGGDSRGARLRAGLYFARIAQGGASDVRRLPVLP